MINTIIWWFGVFCITILLGQLFAWTVRAIIYQGEEFDRYRAKVLRCEDRLNKLEKNG